MRQSGYSFFSLLAVVQAGEEGRGRRWTSIIRLLVNASQPGSQRSIPPATRIYTDICLRTHTILPNSPLPLCVHCMNSFNSSTHKYCWGYCGTHHICINLSRAKLLIMSIACMKTAARRHPINDNKVNTNAATVTHDYPIRRLELLWRGYIPID